MENKKNDTRDRELRMSRTINAPVELLWEVWTNPEHIKNWWGPNGFTNTIQQMDVRPGGEWDLVMHGPDGTDYKNKSVFKEVIPFKKIVYEHISAPKFVSTIEFKEQGNQTLLTWHMLFDTVEEFIRVVKTFKADEGLKQNIEKLGVYLAGLKMPGRAPINGLRASINGQRAPINGLDMYYEIQGAGDLPLVLIHGGGSTIESSFGNLLPLLASYGKIITLELQAHGRTSDRETPESFQQDADDVAALLAYLKVDKANVLGFSNGGSTALQLGIRHPKLIHKIVAISAVTKRNGLIGGFFEGMEFATLDHMPEGLQKAYLKVSPDEKGLLAMFNRDKERMLTFMDWREEELKSIKAPTLLMVADRDVVTVEHTIELSRLIPDVQLVVLPGVHGAMIGEVCAVKKDSRLPEMTVLLVEEFLRE